MKNKTNTILNIFTQGKLNRENYFYNRKGQTGPIKGEESIKK